MHLLAILIEFYSYVVLISIIGSWLGSSVGAARPLFAFADKLTDPVLQPIRQKLPATGGLDLSPMVLLIGLQLLARFFGG